jgi:signal transduction histidine kinase/CheY-like chemotaxis protein
MEFIKKIGIYLIVVACAVVLCFFVHFFFLRTMDYLRDDLEKSAQEQLNTNVNSVIDNINTLKKYNDDETVKKIIHDQITYSTIYKNQYLWINEIVDYEGGDNYAIRFVHPNLPETEGNYLSTNLTDDAGNTPYLTELESIKKHGELTFSYYFKNYLDDTVELKYTYAKYYAPYHWVIACGIPQSDLFRTMNYIYSKSRYVLLFFYSIITLLAISACLIIYFQKKKNSDNNKMQVSKASAIAKNKAKSEFLATISHELRTPLSTIIGLNDLLRENANDEDAVLDYSYKIEQSSMMLLTLINDVLDMSAIEKGKLKIADEDFNVKRLIYSVSDMYYNLTKRKGIEFKVNLSQIQAEELIGDEYRIRQIILNLLSNAYKFTDHGGIIISVKEEKLDSTHANLILEVEDTGCGMNSETLSKLYDQFEQADASTVRMHGGSGLGLSITKHLVSMMAGTIDVKSKVGEGTKFTVSLPLKISTRQENIEVSFLASKAIIVDDDEQTCVYLSKVFDSWNIENKSFTDSQEALEYIKRKPDEYSIYVFDFLMPNINGIDLAKEVKKINKKAVIIIVSGYDIEEIKAKDNKCVSSFIQKPIFKSELYNHIINNVPEDTRKEKKLTDENFRDKKVLCVEDVKINQMIITKLLEKVGITVYQAGNGIEAVEFMKNNEEKDNINLILMDIRMPKMDGLTATSKIREFNTEVPIIALSANAFEEDINKSLAAGMNNHLSKPIDKEKLGKLLEEYLD